jgi:regulator of nucleoside diphosphate kinase
MYACVANRLPEICLIEEEYELLSDLVCSSERPTPGIELLWRELQRAVVVPADSAPSGLVHLQSLVSFTELGRSEHRAAQVVPPSARLAPDRVSVVTPVGAALIGLRCGDTFRWRTEAGRFRALHVDAVAPDPRDAARRQAVRAAARRRKIDEILSLR